VEKRRLERDRGEDMRGGCSEEEAIIKEMSSQ